MPLTDEQKEIVEIIGKPVLVLAGPGTGKTEVLAQKILYLLNNNIATKGEIISVTFTTKASGQMRKRLVELGLSEEDHPLICTLHSLALRMQKKYGNEIGISPEFLIADDHEASLVLADAIFDINPNLQRKIKEISSKILLLKAKNIRPENLTDNMLKNVYSRYQEILSFHSALDFSDLIMEAIKLLENTEEVRTSYGGKARNILVDEFQDINDAEYHFFKLLADDVREAFVVGDDIQSIYSWRGGNPKIILGLPQDFVETITKPMTICFRCPEKVIKGADEFIGRKPPLHPIKRNPDPIIILDCKSDLQEARYISNWIKTFIENKKYSPKDIAILYRGGDIADKIAESLTTENIPIIRPSPEETKHLREFIAGLRLIVDRRDSLALRVCLSSRLARGIGPKAIKKIRDYSEKTRSTFWDTLTYTQKEDTFERWHKSITTFKESFEDLSTSASRDKLKVLLYNLATQFGFENESRIIALIKRSEEIPEDWSLYDFIQEIRGLKGEKISGPKDLGENEEDAVLFITTHSVKGLQRKVIFVIGMEKGRFPSPRGEIAEQRRLFYVAMTRTEDQLFLCYAKKREGRAAHGFNFFDKSPFIFDIPEKYRIFIRPN